MSGGLPRAVRRLLALTLPEDQRDPITGDLEEAYAGQVRRLGTVRAAVWAWWNAARLAASFARERALGRRGIPPIAEELRTRSRMWESLVQDVTFGVRMLRRQPGFTAVAVLALALGIGANTAIFSVVDAVLWRPLPFPRADRLVAIGEQRAPDRQTMGPVAPADFVDWRARSRAFTTMAAASDFNLNLSGDGEPQRLRALALSPGFLDALGIEPARGRVFRAEEEEPGSLVAILSDNLWRARFGSDPQILGRKILLNAEPYEVIGVMPAGFWWTSNPEVIVPLRLSASQRAIRSLHSFKVVARRRPGVSIDQARAEMDAIGRKLAEQYPAENTGHAPMVVPLRESLVGDMRDALLLLLVAVGLVLVIACANVSTLLMARGTTRRKEIAIRLAMGAGRWRLVRQLLTESVVLAFIGGGAGVLFASWSVAAMGRALPARLTGLPGLDRVSVDGRVLAAAIAATLATSLLFGVLPAAAAARQDLGATLNEEGRSGTTGVHARRARAALVVAEMALSVVLLVGAGLLLVSFHHLTSVAPGFQAENVVTMRVTLPGAKYGDATRVVQFYESLLARIRTMPGVDRAGAVTLLPFGSGDSRSGFLIENRTEPSPIPVRAHPRLVSPDYLAAMRIPLIRGRFFTERDAGSSPEVVIINETTARRFWPNEDPLGRRISFEFNPPRWLQIVGIAGDVKHQRLDAAANPEAYLPYLQSGNAANARGMTIVVRTRADAATLAPLMRGAVRELDADQPVGAIRGMEELVGESVAPQRLNLLLVAAFAIVALTLTAAGLYGLMAYLVAQRTHEIGIRIALGASPGSVLALMLRQAGTMTLAGLVLGVAGALGLTRWLTTILFGVRPTDAGVYVAVSALLAVVAFLAVVVPSSRATRVDPLKALRQS
jgi:putative ABC transport system permease protein